MTLSIRTKDDRRLPNKFLNYIKRYMIRNGITNRKDFIAYIEKHFLMIKINK